MYVNVILISMMIMMISIPNACACVSSGFRHGEEGQVIISRGGNWCILWPVISKVMNQCASSFVHHGMPDKAIWVVWGCDKLYIRTVLVETPSVTGPFIQTGLQAIGHGRVGLQKNFVQEP